MSAEKFGEYEVLKREDGSLFELGRGAMGVTYKAFDTDLRRFVALKTISSAAMAHPEAEERFIREARSAAQLRHPNIAGIFRRDKTPEGTHYYAMEFCEGRTIEHLVKEEGPLDWTRALEITAQAAKALAAAAGKNLIHRDIKPANLMLVREDQGEGEGEVLKLIDFGLAKITADDDATWSSMGTQGFVGTAHFASPEQIQNGIVDTRSDIYSLGATLWFMLRGSPPFTGSIWEVISKHVTAIPDSSLLRGAPETVVELVRAMMEKNPADRPQTARELLDEIKECLHPEPGPVSDVEPAPDESAPDMQPTLADWTVSLRDLLRTRRKLEPAEAWLLGDKLATILDEECFANTSKSALLVQGISINFQAPLSESDARARFHEPVTEWPPFGLSRDTSASPFEGETVLLNGMETIIAASDLAGDRVQQLARVLYELLGGVAGAQFPPLGRPGEEGNAVLRRGITEGIKAFPHAWDLIVKLRAVTADDLVHRPAPRRETTVHPLTNDKTSPDRRRKVLTAIVVSAMALTSCVVFGWMKYPFPRSSSANAEHSGSVRTPKHTSALNSVEGKSPPIASPGNGGQGIGLNAGQSADGSVSPEHTQAPNSTHLREDSARTDRFEEQITQGKTLRERGDPYTALLRFREAAATDPKSPVPIAEIAATYEKMGLSEKAGEQWRLIYDRGEKDGIYFSLAEAKLKVGMTEAVKDKGPPAEIKPVIPGIAAGMTLGLLPIRVEDRLDPDSSKRFTLQIPIRSRPQSKIDPHELVVQVLFFDILNAKNVVETNANLSNRWLTTPPDWVNQNTEELAVEYQLPMQEPKAMEIRKYFGYIVRIYYKNQLQAAIADPERLGQQYPPPPILPAATPMPRPATTPAPPLGVNKPMVYVPATPAPPKATPPIDNATVVRRFMMEHSAKVNRGDIEGFAKDFASPIEYLGETDTRAQILWSERTMVTQFKGTRETVLSLEVKQMSPTVFEALVTVEHSSARSRSLGKSGRQYFSTIVEITPNGPQITRVRELGK